MNLADNLVVRRDPNTYDMRVTDEIVAHTKATRHRAADIPALILKT